MRVHAGLRHRRQQTADPRGPAPCGPADHRQRGHVPEEQRGAAAVPWTSLTSQWISPTHVGTPRKALQSSIESFVVSSLLSNMPAGLWSVISFIYFEFHSLVCRLPTNCWWQEASDDLTNPSTPNLRELQLLLNQFSFHLCCRKLRKCSCLSLNPSCRLPLFPPQNFPSWLKSACTTQRPTHTTLSRTGGIHSLMEDFQTRYSHDRLPSCICVNHVFMKSVAAVVLGVCCGRVVSVCSKRVWACVVSVCCGCCFISAFVRLFRSPPPPPQD